MDAHASDIESQALKLDPATRARLALRLIQSIDQDESLASTQVESLWLREAEERLRRLEYGEDVGVPAEEAIAQARMQLGS